MGVALVMLFTGLARGMSNDLQRRSSNLRAEIIFTRPGALELTSSSANLSTKYVERVQAIEGVESAVPVILYFFQGNRGFGFEQIEGVDWPAFAKMNEIQLVEGRAPEAADEVVVDVTKARNGKLRAGSQLMLFGNKTYRMQDLLEAPGKCTYILVKCKEGVDASVVANHINSELPGNKIQFTRDVFTSVEKSVPYLGLFLRVLVGLAAVVSALVVMLAMYTTITERTREIGILKALGASRGYIVGVIEKEAILISTMGLVAGFIVALLAGFLIHRFYGLVFEFGLKWAITAAAIGLLGGVIGALYPAVRAANLDAVSALAYE